MKVQSVISTAALFGACLAAPAADNLQGHAHLGRRHQHNHNHPRNLVKRDVVIVYETVTVDKNGRTLGTGSATTTAQQAPAAAVSPQAAAAPVIINAPQAVKQADNVLTAAQQAAATTPIAVPIPTTSSKQAAAPAPAAVDTPVIPASAPAPTSQAAAQIPSTPVAAAPVASPVKDTTPVAPVSGGVGSLAIDGSTGAFVGKQLADFVAPSGKFQDGTLACSSFPSMYEGVVSLPYLGKGGYNSIQLGTGNFEQIDTCKPGYYCSYACQPGMSKTQWPEDGQPANGVSIGGLRCGNDGMLYLSRPSVPYLCQWDHQAALVENQASQAIAIGRTVYPGSENMVDPTFVKPGAIAPLSVPDQNIFKWRGNPTSAQYYVNNAGVSQQDGCAWGTPGSGLGNWAPMNFGAGYADGIAWLALIGNPNNQAGTNFKIKIVSVSGTMNGECGYDGQKYTGSSSTSNGCTVACKGVCKFVMY